jgi:hypothetical protein
MPAIDTASPARRSCTESGKYELMSASVKNGGFYVSMATAPETDDRKATALGIILIDANN